MQDEWFRSGEGFFIIYAIVERRTLEEAARLREKVLRIKNKDKVAMVLCGNKADLEHERQVPASEGKNLAAKWGKYRENNHKITYTSSQAALSSRHQQRIIQILQKHSKHSFVRFDYSEKQQPLAVWRRPQQASRGKKARRGAFCSKLLIRHVNFCVWVAINDEEGCCVRLL